MGDEWPGAAVIISMKCASFARKENPILEIHIGCKFNFTLGAIKPFFQSPGAVGCQHR
jgi:hypothetical protein